MECESLTYAYPSGRRGVDELALRVERGDTVALLGPNGAGKSTVIRLMAGLLKPGGSRVTALGSDPAGMVRSERRRLGVALDRPAHWESLTGSQNAVLLARASGLPTADAARRADALLRRFGLDGKVAVRHYSLGMKRKLLLIEAMLHAPEVLLLDEPTLGLDPDAVDVLAAELSARARAGAAVVLATNDVRAAPLLASRVVFLLEGRKAAEGTVHDFLMRDGARTRFEVVLAEGEGAHTALLRDARLPRDISLREEDGVLVVDTTRGAAPLPELLQALLQAGVGFDVVRIREPDLADVFREFTGTSLVDRSHR